ncbi:MAG: YdcF family protein [Rhodospirillaceae bacterium]
MSRASLRLWPRSGSSLVERGVHLVGRVVIALLVVLALWLPGLVWFSASMPQEVPDTATRTEAVVVLTGGSERLRTSLTLIEADAADLLFVSGVHPGTTLDVLLAEVRPTLAAEVRDRIELGHVAADTVGNAIETAVWVRERGLKSLRLVTASYHMPRSLLEFRAALPDVVIVPHPVFPENVKQGEWWRYPGTTLLFATEYTKYLVAHLRLLLPDRPPRAVVVEGSSPP